MMLLFGIGLMSPIGAALNNYISGEDLPNFTRGFLVIILFILGFLLTSYSYSIMYDKDEKNDRD